MLNVNVLSWSRSRDHRVWSVIISGIIDLPVGSVGPVGECNDQVTLARKLLRSPTDLLRCRIIQVDKTTPFIYLFTVLERCSLAKYMAPENVVPDSRLCAKLTWGSGDRKKHRIFVLQNVSLQKSNAFNHDIFTS